MAVVASRPDVGSSSSINEGLISSSCPTDTLFRSPPDIPLFPKPPMHETTTLVRVTSCQAKLMMKKGRWCYANQPGQTNLYRETEMLRVQHAKISWMPFARISHSVTVQPQCLAKCS